MPGAGRESGREGVAGARNAVTGELGHSPLLCTLLSLQRQQLGAWEQALLR